MPTPQFLLLRAAGIDISDRSIKYAALEGDADALRLGTFGEVALEPGIVEGGRIVAPEKLEQALAGIRAKEGFSFVRSALPEEQAYFFRTNLPSGAEDSLRETIELSLEEHVPVGPQEAEFDFDILRREKGTIDVAVAVSPKAVVQNYADVFRAAGFTLLSLELEANAVARATAPFGDSVARLFVDFGETRTLIAVACGQEVCLTSTIGIGGAMLTETLAKHFNVSPQEAETMKREYGLKPAAERDELFALLLNNVSVLRDEINKHFIYWHTHADESGAQRPPIEEIVLVGGDSNLYGLSDYLATSLRVKVSMGSVWQNIPLPAGTIPALSKSDSLGYVTAIGLALAEADTATL